MPTIPCFRSTVANLNIDMIGRTDADHEDDPRYVYLIGADKLSSELHEVSEYCNETYTNLALDYTYNAPDDPNRFYYRSDHYNFAKNNIPVIFTSQVCMRITTSRATIGTRSCTPKWRKSASWCSTRRGTWPTWITALWWTRSTIFRATAEAVELILEKRRVQQHSPPLWRDR